MEYAAITAVGHDRQGIMDDLATAVGVREANIEETKAAILGGEFAVIMLVSGSTEAIRRTREELSGEFAGKGLAVSVRPTGRPTRPKGLPYLVETVSLDTPGIVRSVTAVLRKHGINIEELESVAEAAPLSGAPLFRMKILVDLTPGPRLNALREDLASTAEEHDLDLAIRPLPAGSADI